MAANTLAHSGGKSRKAAKDPFWVQTLLIGIAVTFIGLFLVLPLAVVFIEALRHGFDSYRATFSDPTAWQAIKLTLIATGIAVPLNLVFGVAASWAIAKFEFPGKSVLITLIDLPFAVSPVISGLIYVLVFGLQGWFGPTLDALGIKVIFAAPGGRRRGKPAPGR